MSNGVEVLVKDKSADTKMEQKQRFKKTRCDFLVQASGQSGTLECISEEECKSLRKLKFMHPTTMLPPHQHSSPSKTLLSSAVATFINRQHMSALFPLHQFTQHNYIIKTCMTTYTYLTTVVHDKRSAISTFETIVSVVTTESLMNPYATELLQDIKPTKTKYMEVKTIQPTASSNMFVSNYPKIDKRIDNEENINSFDLIQPSESGHVPCTSSCSCSHTKTEGLKTKYTNINHSMSATTKYGINTSNYGATILDRPTKMETVDIKTRYGPYDYEGSQMAPTDRIVEKYTEVVNDYSDEKDSNVMQESELLTNEQGPSPPKPSKVTNNKSTEKPKPEKPLKPNKNKVLVADLLKLGSLGIKGLSQLGPVIEKMTGGFIKRQESNKTTIPTTTTTTTIKPVKITPYHVNKRIDNDIEMKQNHFPIYIPVDELETSESQIIFTNATLHQNLAWAAEQKTHNARIVPPRMIHESPLVNGGIPISPGEVITANSDVIVGKPAVGGPMTLAASGFKLHNPVNPPPIDSFVSANEQYVVKEKPEPSDHKLYSTKGGDDSYDLRPPELPKSKPKPNRNLARPASVAPFNQQNSQHPNNNHHRLPPLQHQSSDHIMKTEHVKISSTVLGNHGRPAFLDYIPAFAKPNNNQINNNNNFRPEEQRVEEIPDNSPSSSEMVHTRITTDGDYTPNNSDQINKPLLVDIQPSRVANVLIPHGSTTALVFAGSSEPHKTGDYIDDPLPYPEPGYFGSFSIDAPQMTNVHNVPPNNNKQFTAKPAHTPMESYKPITSLSFKDQAFRSDFKLKFKGNKRPIDFNKLPPPTSNQESHLRVGPQITAYNPDIYNPNNGDFEKYNNVRGNNNYKDGKEIIDKEYENYLAVPPPPPPKIQLNKENFYDKNKPYSQRPIVHMKPVQDMKVFLNIQHPVPEAPQPEPLPPKITSEIYFAAQAPSNEPTTTYTIKLPPAGPAFENNYNIVPNNNQHYKIQNINSGQYSNSFTVMSSPNFANKSIFTNDVNDKDSTYTVTLNTATNVANNVGETGQVIGSSVPVAIESNTNVGLLNTDIPIGTNFAIKVEDGPSLIDNYNLQSNQNPLVYSDETDRVPIEVSIGDNRWNKSTSDNLGQKFETTIIGQHYYDQNIRDKPANRDNIVPPSLNSHANFPMVNDYYTTSTNVYNDIKPVTEDVDEVKSHDQRRPAKLIPNIPTNSHGWYSSNLFNENSLSKINNIKVEVTTRKSIPLLHDFNNNSVPDFGQKITSNGKPPARYRPQITPPVYSKYNIGKPFTKPTSTTSQSTHRPFLSLLPFTTKPYRPDYILHSGKQPAYDIPIRDNSDETTTIKTVTSTKETVKPVFENSEEVYDGEDDIVENDGEISQESMKVPVITTSNEEHTITNISKSASETTTSRDGVFKTTEDNQIDTNTRVEFDPGTQTEKPFGSNNNTNVFYSNTIRPIYDHMKPRPFTVKTVLDHQLHQPHWQINELMVNSSNGSYEENLSLNIGEEMSSGSTNKPSSTQDVPHYHHVDYENKYRIPQKPTSFSKNVVNDSNIITSTVHINDKKPLIVEKVQHTSTTTLPPISLTTSELDRSSSEIIDLSPPPPTMDYNFKPSTNDEMIMGMSPPPPRTQSSNRPLRTQPTPRPNRTPPPYRSKPPRTLPPRLSSTPKPMRRPISRDEISTYRPAYDIMNNVRRPIYHRDQPSSQLLPPPREIPSRVITPISELPSQTINVPPVSNIVFPTPISSGWLTSSGVGFSSSFDFAPTSVHYPDIPEQSTLPGSLTDNSYSYEMESSSERFGDVNPEKPVTENIMSISKEVSTDSDTKLSSSSEEQNVSDVVASESSHEETTTDKMKVIPISNKNRTRKPYPVRHEDKKPSTNKYRLPSKPTSIIRPTKTLLRPEILYSTRHTSTRKIVRPIPTRTTPVIPISIIESSEMSIEDEFVKPTEVLRQSILPTTILHDVTSFIDKVPTSIVTSSSYEISSSAQPTYQADYTVSDQITPTKTEFRTTVVTLTKTLSESPKTVSSIGYVNLTHTLTITHTKTSLVSQSEGAVTQTLVLTNTHTSTIVDVVTKIRTQVQPTTIIETVTKHIPIIQVEPTTVQEILPKTKVPLDDITMSSEENDNLIIRDSETTENVQKVDTESDSDANTFFVVMNKSQNGGKSPPINTDLETGDYDVTRNEQVNNNGVSQVLFGEILLAGTPYLETTNVVNPTGTGFGKECHPDCKASRNERCQRIDGMMKCVCRPGFARMFPDRPCKPTYTYSVKLALGYQGSERLEFHQSLADNSSKQYHALEVATHEGINRMVMQSDLRDVFHGVHITGFHPVEINKGNGDVYQGVMNDFYVQLSDNAHESRLKEVIEKYLRNNNYSLGGTEVLAAGELMDGLNVSDFDECTSGQFHDCSEHAQCFNLRGTYTCSCLEGFADLSVNSLYPGRICSAEPVGCERCNYHGACYSRDDRRVLCECFQWYAGSTCHINLKVVLISLVVLGALLTIVLGACAVVACRRPRPPPRSIVTCIQGMPSLHQGAMPSKQRADRRALISDRGDSGDASSIQNASLPYMPAKSQRASTGKKCVISEPPSHDPPPPPAPAVMIPRARLHPHHTDSRENVARKRSLDHTSPSEAKLISYLESGAVITNDEMRRKHSMESSYSAHKDRHNKQGALVSAGFKVSTTIRPDEVNMRDDRDDLSSVHKADLEAELHFDSLRKTYSQEDMSEWTDAERRIGELTLSEARSVGGTLPASTGRAASSTRLTHQEANTMAERDLGSTFLLPHVHLYKPDLTSDVSEFDSL